MRWVGDISYEMYLWHWPLYLVLTPDRLGLGGAALLAVRLSAVVALSAVTHFYVGEPIRRGVRLRSPRLARDRHRRCRGRGGGRRVRRDPHLTSGAERRGRRGGAGRRAARGPECRARPRARRSRSRRGTGTGRAPSPVKVLVVGDSQAATLAQGLDADPGVHGLSAQPGLAVWNRAILGCSIITVPTFVIDGDRAENRCGGSRRVAAAMGE